MTDHYQLVPIRNDLLEDIGRVNWLSIRLHSTVRDRRGKINGVHSDDLFEDFTLGSAIKELRKLAVGNNENSIAQWCTDIALPASDQRNGLVHAIAITNIDGDQALKGTKKNGRIEYSQDEIKKIADVLAHATTSIPDLCATNI